MVMVLLFGVRFWALTVRRFDVVRGMVGWMLFKLRLPKFCDCD